MNKLFATLLLISLSIFSYGQGIITFEKKTHDFGEIKEGSIATYEFVFTNTGNQPVVIDKAKPSCGCTTPFYTRKPVQPGEKGSIKASFKSAGRPGSFNKSITIYSNAQEGAIVLFIKGKVNGRNSIPKTVNNNTTVKNTNTAQLKPKLTLDKDKFNFGRLENRSAKSERFVIKNTGKSTLKILGYASMCQCIRYEITTSKIRPGSAAILTLTYIPQEATDLKEVFTIYSDDPDNTETPIELSAEVYENFSKAMFIGRKESIVFE